MLDEDNGRMQRRKDMEAEPEIIRRRGRGERHDALYSCGRMELSDLKPVEYLDHF